MLLSMRTRHTQADSARSTTNRIEMYRPKSQRSSAPSRSKPIQEIRREKTQMNILNRELSITNNKERKPKSGSQTRDRRCFTKGSGWMVAEKNSNLLPDSAGYNRIHKSRSAETIEIKDESCEADLNRLSDSTETEGSYQIRRFIAAEVSPIINRKSFEHINKPQLPRVLQLKLNERRRSRSMQDLNTVQRAALERAFTSALSFREENQAWSRHWQIARKDVIRKRQGLPSISSVRPDRETVITDIDKNDMIDDDVVSYGNNLETTAKEPKEPSLEERLALIERKQGIIHAN